MKPSLRPNREGGFPRSVFGLALLLVVAATALWFVSHRRPGIDLTLGGPLLDLRDSTIDGFLLTHQGAQYRFERDTHGYWTLRGAVTDFLDQSAVNSFLGELQDATGGRVLPGTEVQDRRFEFNGTDSQHLTVFTTDGRQQALAVGIDNPVTGYFYASGLGRAACFPVTAALRERLAALPAALQLRVLLPPFDRRLIQEIDLYYGGEAQFLRQREGRWYLRMAGGNPEDWPAEVRAYHQVYGDRRIQDQGSTWLLADSEAVEGLIYQCSEIIVNRIPSPRMAQARLREWELDPPWRRVILRGATINPDSSEAAGNELELAFGPPLASKDVPVLRRGNVLFTEHESVQTLGGSLQELLDLGALSFTVAGGDSLTVRREGTLLLQGFRGPVPQVAPGQQQRPLVESWQTIYPRREQRSDLSQLSYNGLVRNLIVNLDRLEILKVFPPTTVPDVLAPREKVTLLVSFSGQEKAAVKLEFGYLLGPWATEAVESKDGLPPVAMHCPASGQLLQVPGHILVTMRNHFTALKEN